MLTTFKALFNSIRFYSIRKDKWRRYCFLKRETLRDSPRRLSTLLSALGYADSNASLDAWYEQLKKKLNSPNSQAYTEHYHKLLSTIPFYTLPSSIWLDLYRLVMGLGFFYDALPLREKALKKATQDAKKANTNLKTIERGFAACIDQGDFTQAEKLIERMRYCNQSQQKIDYGLWLIKLLQGQLKKDSAPTTISPEFLELVKNKKIAMVGPVPSEAGSGHDIDGYNLVVKFNYRGGSKGLDPKMQGSRIDIAYYNISQSKVFAKQNYYDVFNSLSAAVFVKEKAMQQFTDKTNNMRSIYRLDWALLDSELNVGPNAMLDCLAAGAKKIKVFNTDLMLTAGRVTGYRPSSASPIDYKRSFVKTHDPVMQYNIFRHAWDAGLIDGDAVFKQVMEMGLENYICKLQSVHGANFQKIEGPST